ncbi:unnamed protein product [Echinostoma caproni]|uniref:Protein patched n=1 Tax=Echinostoma caproni TaxID=27848 RepID=A0A183AJ22_9TREM|nr:unnamed protein product [Echinostoma caproni]
MFATSLCCTTMRLWWRSKFARFEGFLHTHQWKVLSIVLLLVLFCLGLKMVTVDTDFDKLWVEESDRLISEWTYLAQALKRVSSQTAYTDQHYFGPDARRTRMMLRMNGARVVPSGPILDSSDPLSPGFGATNGIPGPHQPSTSGPFANSLPGREFMGTMETILQSATGSATPEPYPPVHDRVTGDEDESTSASSQSSTSDPQLLTPQALLDHMEFLIKVRRLQITVGSAKWSFKDLCQRASLPFGSEVHPIQAYLDMIIPCLIITPLDCFWEGAKVLGPEEATWVPWLGERTLIQWPNLDPVGLLRELRTHYGNQSHHLVDSLIAQFQSAGINHGYLNRTCLDPTDPACPISAPNYRGKVCESHLACLPAWARNQV